MDRVPLLELNDGNKIPAFGLGTWQAEPGMVGAAVKEAIDLGYRHFDCAMLYGNEAEIGQAIRDKIEEGTVKREQLYIVSKLWNQFHAPQSVIPECKKSLARFGLDYLDLYLIHWPMAQPEHPNSSFPSDNEGNLLFTDDDYLDTWKEMEKCVESGLVKSIGVSNFNSEQITRILKAAKIKPVTNQVECHPYLNQKKLNKFCKQHGILLTAFSPLGSPARPWAKPGEPNLLEDPKLLAISKRLGKTPGQIVLAYLIHLGVIPIPKSTRKERLSENIRALDVKLSLNDLEILDSFDVNGRICAFEQGKHHKYYPFNIEY